MIQDRDHFPIWLTENGLTGTGVEVGVYYGRNAEHILKNWPGRLVGVDPYVNYPKDEYRDGCNLVDLAEARHDALKLLDPFGERFQLLRMPSTEAAALEFEDLSLDFVYIDGNHDYEHVIQDLNAWYKKVKHGGVLGGHDYYERDDAQQRCHVQTAVNNWCHESDYEPTVTNCTSWWIFKT